MMYYIACKSCRVGVYQSNGKIGRGKEFIKYEEYVTSYPHDISLAYPLEFSKWTVLFGRRQEPHFRSDLFENECRQRTALGCRDCINMTQQNKTLYCCKSVARTCINTAFKEATVWSKCLQS